MEKIGTYLKKIRKAKGLSLNEVSEHTKISPWHIERLEKDEYDKLPQGPYIKGYLVSYAQMLEIDEKDIIDLYQPQNSTTSTEICPSKFTKNQSKDKSGSTIKNRLLLAGTIVFFIATATWLLFLRKENPEPTATPPTLTTAEARKAITESSPRMITLPSPNRSIIDKSYQMNSSAESLSSKTPQVVDPESRQVTEFKPVDNESAYVPPDFGTETDNGIEVLMAVASTGVKNRSPVGPDKIFSRSTPRIYIFNKIKCIQPPSIIRHVYFFKNRKISEVELSIRAPLWRTWSYKTISSERMVGKWRVDIVSADGKMLAQVPLTIQ